MATTPVDTIERSHQSVFQIVAIAVIVGLNGLDVLAISFAAPGIAEEFGINRGALGFVLAAELVSMGIGSIVLGGVADKIGRRPMILGCLVAMLAGMLLSSRADSIATLAIWRVLTGVGIGGMLAAITAAAAEHSNEKNRSLCVALSAIGYPIGAVLGGSVAAWLLANHDWRAVFVFGACITAAFIPLVLLRVPETVAFLCQRQPHGALDRINTTLARMGHAKADALPEPTTEQFKGATSDLFAPGLIAITLLVTAAYFAHIATFYFILKWIPKIVVDMGFAASSAAGVLVWANVGGALRASRQAARAPLSGARGQYRRNPDIDQPRAGLCWRAALAPNQYGLCRNATTSPAAAGRRWPTSSTISGARNGRSWCAGWPTPPPRATARRMPSTSIARKNCARSIGACAISASGLMN